MRSCGPVTEHAWLGNFENLYQTLSECPRVQGMARNEGNARVRGLASWGLSLLFGMQAQNSGHFGSDSGPVLRAYSGVTLEDSEGVMSSYGTGALGGMWWWTGEGYLVSMVLRLWVQRDG
jgi:hypothetical protein